jgi:hypothetical protein
MSTLKHLQGEIASRMRRGDAFVMIEDEVINASRLSDPEKAALWLYGWSFVDWRRQRREAVAHIDLLVANQDPETPSPTRTRRSRPIRPSPMARREAQSRGPAGRTIMSVS